MRRFAALLAEFDAGRDEAARQAALQTYLAEASAADAAWGLFLLVGGRPPPALSAAALRAVIQPAAAVPDWLFEASRQVVGDLAETLAQLLPPPRQADDPGLAVWLGERLPQLRHAPADHRSAVLLGFCAGLPADARSLLLKLTAGSLRLDWQALTVQRALACHGRVAPWLVAQRLPSWADRRLPPSAERLAALLAPEASAVEAAGRPLDWPPPQALAEAAPDRLALRLGEPGDWLLGWQHGGQRAQIVRRAGGVWIWHADGRLLNARLPELLAAARRLPDGCVIDGELLAWRDGEAAPLPPSQLQRRLDRKTLDRRLLAELPLRLVAHDLLELAGEDLRGQGLRQRHQALAQLAGLGRLAPAPGVGPLQLSRPLAASSWAAVAALCTEARGHGLDGLLLRRHAAGGDAADRGGWILREAQRKVAAVLVYAQAGAGRGLGRPTDYSFALWNRPPADAAEAEAALQAIDRGEPAAPGALQLVTVARTAVGLTAAERAALAPQVRAQTLQKFGPVRSLRPRLVFELGFEGVDRSPRRSSGISLRLPCMRCIRHDLAPQQADALPALYSLLPPESRGSNQK